MCIFCKSAKALTNLQHLTIVLDALDGHYNDAASREVGLVEVALRKLEAEVKVM